MGKKNNLNISKIDKLLKLAKSPPDESLLGRFFSICIGEEIESALTEKERHWVSVNLDGNPAWQEKWHELETDFGNTVDWKANAWTPSKAAAKPKRQSQKLALTDLFDRVFPTPALRLAAAAVIICIVVYSGLRTVGNATLSKTYHLASISDYEGVLSENVRGEGFTNEFSDGISELLAAPSDWLGLFPHYDRGRVDQAIQHLTHAFQTTEDEFQKSEIAFFLGKAYLMKKDIAKTRQWLNQVIAQNVADYRKDARDLLQKLATDAQR